MSSATPGCPAATVPWRAPSPPSVYYTEVSGSTELIAGEGLTSRTVVLIGGVRVRLRFLSAGLAVATIPQGATGTKVTVAS